MKFNKKVIITISFVFILTFAIFIWGKIMPAKPICDKCNVVLISIDALSALHLPCYGYERDTAPNLCKYADENINFLNSYSQSPYAISSNFSILTSLYPHTHKMTSTVGNILNERYLTLAELYRMNGYKTFYYGPSKNMHLPLNRGIERGFDYLNTNYTKNNEENWGSVYQELTKKPDQENPSFFFLHTPAVHEPYFTGHKSNHLFTNQPEYPNIPLTQGEYGALSPQLFSSCASRQVDSNSIFNGHMSKIVEFNEQKLKKLAQVKNLQEGISVFSTLDEDVQKYCIGAWNRSRVKADDPNQIEYLKALYDEQIYNMDQRLGKFLKLMADPKLAKNTIIIITSDHGEEFMEHGYLYHGNNIFRTSTQVPLIMHVPGITSKKIPELAQAIDIYPTVASLTNIAPKSPIEGINLTGLIKGEKNALTNTYIRSELKGVTAIQSQNLRYYYNESTKSPIGLYNLTVDPQEQNDLKGSNPEVISQFKVMLK